MINNSHQIVHRVAVNGSTWFLNLDDDFADGGENWHGNLEGLHERLEEIFGPTWKERVEIQKWELSEKRIEA